MSVLFQLAKWGTLTIVAALIVAIIVALLLRQLSAPPRPNGQLLDVGGVRLNIECAGTDRGQPTIVIESGAGTSSLHYHWLFHKLAQDTRVCRYDRAGIGFSELGASQDNPDDNAERAAESVARNLHRLLQLAGLTPPYIMLGHSLGGPYSRIYADMFPGEVVGFVFLDASHPEQVERLGVNPTMPTALLKAAELAGSLGLLNLYFTLFGKFEEHGNIPLEMQRINQSFYRSGSAIRGMLNEQLAINGVLARAARTPADLGDTPVLVITAGRQDLAQLRAAGIEPATFIARWDELQDELAALSSNGKRLTLKGGSHMSVATDETQADIVVEEIREMIGRIQDSSRRAPPS